MATLSKHYALIDFDPGNTSSVPVEPISCSVTVDETHAPYVTATVTVQTDAMPYSPDPRNALFLGLRLQQDFGDLIYNYELTNTFGGGVAAFTAAYSQLLATNLTTNPSFELSTSSWGAGEATISRDTTQSYSGVASLKAIFAAIAANGPSHSKSVTALQTYVASAWVKGESGKKLRIRLLALTAGGSYIGESSSGDITATGAWQRITVSRAFGATAEQARIHFENRTTGAHTFYVDAVQLETGSTATEYFDGSTADTGLIDYAWTGTANASTSIKYDPVTPSEITRDYSKPWNVFETALPISTVTAAYGGDVSNLTAADLMEVWRMSDFLHSSGTFNPAPSTIFDGYLMLRSVEKNYLNGETTLELTSHEAILLDSIGSPTDLFFSFTSLRDIINYVLSTSIGALTQLQPGTADYTYSPAYTFAWLPNQTAWDILDALVKAANLVLFCDEKGDWYLQEAYATSGDLYLKDDDNITTLSSRIDRNSSSFFDYAVVEYVQPNDVVSYDTFGTSGFDISKDAYFKVEGVNDPGGNAAQALVWRAVTRGEIYSVEAISNYDARPRQEMTIDVTGEAVKTATVQSITWSLPSARMSLDIRDLQEVI